jgi:THO complex subunit 4
MVSFYFVYHLKLLKLILFFFELGRPMRINTASIISAVSSAPSNNNTGGRRGNPRGGNNSNRRDNNGGGRGGRGRRENRPKPSEQDLDADMDSYMNVGNEDIQMN